MKGSSEPDYPRARVHDPRDIQARSAGFRKDLRLGDLVFSNITMIVGATWPGTAAKLGHAHVVYWLIAGLFFFVPLAITVIALNRWLPLEGGLYQWAKYGLGERFGFMVAYNLWVYAIVILSSLGLEMATFFSYSFGQRTAWMAHDRLFIASVTAALVVFLMALAAIGLKVGRWLHDLGGLARLFEYSVVIGLAAFAWLTGRAHAPAPRPDAVLEVAPAALSLLSINLLGKMGFGAFSGFEYMAIFAGESPDPARAITRSVKIAAPIVLCMFILGTQSVLVFVHPSSIDLIAPIPQAVSAATGSVDGARWLALAVALVLSAGAVGYGSAAFAGVTRLPMVAGWDGLLPDWFTKLHPKRKTPTHSIVFVGAAVFALSFVGMAGVGEQEAYQLFGNVALILYALTYLAMFAIPIVARRHAGVSFTRVQRVAAASGFAMTLLFVVLSIFPIVRTASDALFTAKVVGGIVVANAAGLALYGLAQRARARKARM